MFVYVLFMFAKKKTKKLDGEARKQLNSALIEKETKIKEMNHQINSLFQKNAGDFSYKLFLIFY